MVTIIEMAPAMAREPVEKIAPSSGVKSVVPQVGQPAPRAINPVMRLAFSTPAELAPFSSRFFCQRNTIRPTKIPCNKLKKKVGSQSIKIWLIPKILKKASFKIVMVPEKPVAAISSNLEKPPASKLINIAKKIKVGTKPYQKRFSLVASKIPLPANTKLSSHFLQFIKIIISRLDGSCQILLPHVVNSVGVPLRICHPSIYNIFMICQVILQHEKCKKSILTRIVAMLKWK